jgi:hypothetical protein
MLGHRGHTVADVFGDRADFAIEAGIEPDKHTDHTVWGYMCVWCHGVALGDINERYCSLYPAYANFDWLADNLGSLWADELVGLDDVAAWNFLDGLLYGYHGDIELPDKRTLDELGRDAARWGRFDFLTNWEENFDGYKSFLLCPPGDSARVLSRRLPEPMGRGVAVSQRGFVGAASEFARWFEGESQRLGVSCQRQA